MKAWTHKEDMLLAEIYSVCTKDEICKKLGRTWCSIKTRAAVYGFRRNSKKTWTDEELNQLRQLYPDTRSDELAKRFGVSYTALCNKALSIGLKKSEAYMQSENSGRLTALTDAGKKFRFQKGHRSWNKGKKMQTKGRMAETQFKKGVVPPNTKYDGAKSVRKDSGGRPYTYVRISKAQWKMEHVLIWEQHHGPVPKGMVVVFKDGNTMNVQLQNLEMISRRDLMLRNTIHRYPSELISVIKTRRKLIKTIERNGKEQITGSKGSPIRSN